MAGFDATSSDVAAGAVSSLTFSHTCGVGADRALVVNVHVLDDPTAAIASGVTYGGVAMTEVGTPGGVLNASYQRCQQFVLANPASGANDVVITMGTPVAYALAGGAISATAVDQTTPVRAGSPTTASGDSSSPTVTIPSQTDDLVVDAITLGQAGNPGTAPGVGASQTLRYSEVGAYLGCGGSTEPGAASVVMSWTTTGAGTPEWAIAGLSLANAVGGGGGVVNTETTTDDVVVADPGIVSRARHRWPAPDAFAVADLAVRSATRGRAVTDMLLMAEQTARSAVRGRALTDDIAITEGQFFLRTIGVVTTDGVTLTDDLLAFRRRLRITDDELAVVDSFISSVTGGGGGTINVASSTDFIELSDALLAFRVRNRRADDTVAATDFAAFSKVYGRALSEVIELVDDQRAHRQRYIMATDAVLLADDIVAFRLRRRLLDEFLDASDDTVAIYVPLTSQDVRARIGSGAAFLVLIAAEDDLRIDIGSYN